MLTLHLPPELEERLQRLAQATGRSTAFYVTQAIALHLDDIEDLSIAERRLLDIQAGSSETIPLEQVLTHRRRR
ncbi:TraY domain-containing protein [Pseudomonas frederiksbergensis]|uniref:type II toxin-antitoxin system RelB family antitoxin n=1 Tax=Pseudomonas frederiksbergensis TaxID=104087 RepID=UPI00197EBE2B|nr:TraY domain-containing protein [Pseudomonas frederiksbergensis]MBN3861177.1 TraY domain-containing protein [Pseudomonas frederiksbergensis]